MTSPFYSTANNCISHKYKYLQTFKRKLRPLGVQSSNTAGKKAANHNRLEDFGQYTTVSQDARIIQLGARFIF